MAQYMTIPDVTDAEDLLSLQMDADGKSFNITTPVTATTTFLTQAAAEGRLLPLVVLVTDASMLALDDVYVTSVQFGSGGDAVAAIGLQAQGVRLV